MQSGVYYDKKRLSGMRMHKKVYGDNIQGLTNPAIKRLAHRAGVLRVSGLIYPEVRNIIEVTLTDLLDKTVVFAENEKLKTIQVRHVDGALAVCGLYLGAGVSKTVNPALKTCPKGGRKSKKKGEKLAPKKRRAKPGTAAVRDIKRQQKYSDCLEFAKQSFSRFVRELLQKHGDWRVAAAAMLMIQLSIETYITQLLKDAYDIALAAKKLTLTPKHIHTARKIRKDNY